MINITITKSSITAEGHADYAEYGKDIICAAVSTLAQSFIASIEELTETEVEYKLEPGHIHIKHKDLDEAGELLKRSFYIAVNMISKQYGDYVHLRVDADGR